MKRRACLLSTVLLAACRGDSTRPVTPESLTIVSGNQQITVRGADAVDPLRVRVLGSDGKPFANATVAWEVTQGEAIVGPTSTVTDATGETETRVPLVAIIGSVAISASVRGLTPVSFNIESLDPCEAYRNESLQSSVAGELILMDCDFFAGRFADFFGFEAPQGGALQAQVQTSAFDAALWVYSTDWPYSLGAALDSTDATRNAALKAIVAPGVWIFGVSSTHEGETGKYTLQVSPTSESLDACERVFIMPGVSTHQTLASTDCVAPDGSHHDAFFIRLREGEIISISESSAAFTPLLQIADESGTVVADGIANVGGSVTITFTANATGQYTIMASSTNAAASGSYTITTSALVPSRTAAQQRLTARPWLRLRPGRPVEHPMTRMKTNDTDRSLWRERAERLTNKNSLFNGTPASHSAPGSIPRSLKKTPRLVP